MTAALHTELGALLPFLGGAQGNRTSLAPSQSEGASWLVWNRDLEQTSCKSISQSMGFSWSKWCCQCRGCWRNGQATMGCSHACGSWPSSVVRPFSRIKDSNYCQIIQLLLWF